MRWKPIVFVAGMVGIAFFMEMALRPSPSAFLPGARDVFMEPVIVEPQEYIQTALVRGLVDIRPIVPGHCLIIPKRQVVRFEELTAEELVQLGEVIKKTHEATQRLLGPCDYLLLQKNGPCVGQTVPHVHFHYVPRKSSQKSVLALTLHFAWPFHAKLSRHELEERVAIMKKAVAGEELPLESSQAHCHGPSCAH